MKSAYLQIFDDTTGEVVAAAPTGKAHSTGTLSVTFNETNGDTYEADAGLSNKAGPFLRADSGRQTASCT